MKKFVVSVMVLLLIVSCSKDDSNDVPFCSAPGDVTASNLSSESATLSWTNQNTEATFSVEYGLQGFQQGSGTVVTTSDTTITLAGLNPDTRYSAYIKAICDVDNVSEVSPSVSFETLPPLVVPDFLDNLSDLNLYSGELADLIPSSYAFEYELITPLFTDYAHKQRFIVVPQGASMEYVDDGFPIFPDNTIIAKTFFYNNDERDTSLGNKIIETRILIKKNGLWELGNYIWDSGQTDALLDQTSTTTTAVAISYFDGGGDRVTFDYQIPSSEDCFTCHNNADIVIPIGPKLRSMNINNQIEELIELEYLTNVPPGTQFASLPNWEDDVTYSLEERARAYFDVNCAHCHSPGGMCEPQTPLDFRYETPFNDTAIFDRRFLITSRMQVYVPDYTMPFIGTTMVHDEGYAMILEYVNSL